MQGCKVRKKDDVQMITMTKELQLQAKKSKPQLQTP
jgi:hypothetical protein